MKKEIISCRSLGFMVFFILWIVFPIQAQQQVDRIVRGDAAIFIEISELIKDKNSPPIFVWANFIDGNDANGDDGVVFSRKIPEDVKDYPPDAMYQVKNESGIWVLSGGSGETYREVMYDVVAGRSGILVIHTYDECYIMLWE
ncbi:hypothetical protein FACS1894142_7430 [Spirochaetia bacterium]|nr:hypothetical protein FACS1894142_7430 [Spirochaetia bacterium]